MTMGKIYMSQEEAREWMSYFRREELALALKEDGMAPKELSEKTNIPEFVIQGWLDDEYISSVDLSLCARLLPALKGSGERIYRRFLDYRKNAYGH